MVSRCGEPKFLKLDLTPTWWSDRERKTALAGVAVSLIMAHELRGMHREIRIHLEGIEMEVLNVTLRGSEPCDVRALGAGLRSAIEGLATRKVSVSISSVDAIGVDDASNEVPLVVTQ